MLLSVVGMFLCMFVIARVVRCTVRFLIRMIGMRLRLRWRYTNAY